MIVYKREGEPEYFFRVPNHQPLDTDAQLRALRRAHSLSMLLGAQYDDDHDQFNNEIMRDYCDALEGLIDQAIMMVEASIGHGDKNLPPGVAT